MMEITDNVTFHQFSWQFSQSQKARQYVLANLRAVRFLTGHITSKAIVYEKKKFLR